MAEEAQGVPGGERIAPRQTKAGTLDLTASTLFVGAIEKHALIVQYSLTERTGLDSRMPLLSVKVECPFCQ